MVLWCRAVLSDPDRRSKYDRGGVEQDFDDDDFDGDGYVDISELFAQMFGFGGFHGRGAKSFVCPVGLWLLSLPFAIS
jgi:DnaJ-class molecular chaperone